MGTYYQVVNYDKKEYICLSSIANIKYGAYTQWSYQVAILTVLLGSSYYREIDLPKEFVGKWAKDRIIIENDSEDNESDDWDENIEDRDTKDIGMFFLAKLRKGGKLAKWLEIVKQNFDDWQLKELDKWIVQYDSEEVK